MTVVFVKEEYGFRHYIWFAPMIEQDVVTWWKGVNTVPQPEQLAVLFPGSELYPIASQDVPALEEESSQYIFLHLHRDEDSFMLLPGGEEVHHATYNDDDDFSWFDG
jgi:hypothetical protein